MSITIFSNMGKIHCHCNGDKKFIVNVNHVNTHILFNTKALILKLLESAGF